MYNWSYQSSFYTAALRVFVKSDFFNGDFQYSSLLGSRWWVTLRLALDEFQSVVWNRTWSFSWFNFATTNQLVIISPRCCYVSVVSSQELYFSWPFFLTFCTFFCLVYFREEREGEKGFPPHLHLILLPKTEFKK